MKRVVASSLVISLSFIKADITTEQRKELTTTVMQAGQKAGIIKIKVNPTIRQERQVEAGIGRDVTHALKKSGVHETINTETIGNFRQELTDKTLRSKRFTEELTEQEFAPIADHLAAIGLENQSVAIIDAQQAVINETLEKLKKEVQQENPSQKGVTAVSAVSSEIQKIAKKAQSEVAKEVGKMNDTLIKLAREKTQSFMQSATNSLVKWMTSPLDAYKKKSDAMLDKYKESSN